MREYKAVQFQLESADEQSGEFSGYAAVFGNVDGGGDIIEPGAFTKTLVAARGQTAAATATQEGC